MGQVMASSLLAVCNTVPYLIVSLVGGAVVDNANKKKIMLICDSVAAVCSIIILGCFLSGRLELWILCMANVIIVIDLGTFLSAFMAAGCLAASIMLTVMKQPKRKLSMMYVGSFLCLAGITLFGMGRNLWEWCTIVFLGCFGAPIYSTYQTIILREKVSAAMQGRAFPAGNDYKNAFACWIFDRRIIGRLCL